MPKWERVTLTLMAWPMPATRDRAVIAVATAAVPTLLQMLRVLREGIARLDEQIADIGRGLETRSAFTLFA